MSLDQENTLPLDIRAQVVQVARKLEQLSEDIEQQRLKLREVVRLIDQAEERQANESWAPNATARAMNAFSAKGARVMIRFLLCACAQVRPSKAESYFNTSKNELAHFVLDSQVGLDGDGI